MAFINGLSLSIGIGLTALRASLAGPPFDVGDYAVADYSADDYSLV